MLKVDVRKFFPSIDHGNLRRMLLRVTPVDWRWLSDRFVDAPYDGERVTSWFPGDDLLTPLARPHGLPIGSLTSQIWANLYLSPIDHLLASELGIGSFVRYCDDWLIWDDDPGRLREALSRMHEQATRLRLRLHPRKPRLHRATDSIRVQPETLRPISSLCSATQVIWRTTGGRQGGAVGLTRGFAPGPRGCLGRSLIVSFATHEVEGFRIGGLRVGRTEALSNHRAIISTWFWRNGSRGRCCGCQA